MFIKKLEVQGFKTFADKTILEFDPEAKITAIVGPNGCGKSNLLDAIRWVLGEQSIKLLRGTQSEEIIFAGSSKRKATSLAEAELFIENHSGKLKIDYAQVSIKRKLYRSGESEYYINKELVRLKDIQNLFLDTGLGKGSYSIVGQGQVEQVLTSKPTDRRSLFEEASGINQYKTRKVTSQRKLERTDQNLMRIKDLRAEIHAQLGPLEIQSQKAEEYNQMKKKLSELEIGLYKEQVEKCHHRQEELSKEIQSKKNELNQIQEQNNQFDNQKDSLKLKIKETDSQIEITRTEISGSDHQIEKAQSEIRIVTERRHSQEERITQLKTEIEEIHQELKTLESIRLHSIEDQKAYEISLKEFEHILGTQDEKTKGQESTWKDLNEEIEKLRHQLINLDEEISREKHMWIDLQSQEKYYQEDISTLKKRTSKEQESLEEIQTQQKQVLEKKIQGEQKQNSLGVERDKLFQMRQQKEEFRKKLIEQKNQTKEGLDTKKARLSLLKEMQNNYEGFDRGVKSLLMAKREHANDFGNILGVVADLIQTEKEYETAVEVGLGRLLQAIVVPTIEDAKKSIKYLQAKGLGRVTFIPLDQVPQSQIQERSLATYARAKQTELNPLIEYLLGKVGVCSHLEEAFEIQKSSKDIYRKIVTLPGEIISKFGLVTGGSSKGVTSTLLGRQREIVDLEKAVKAFEEDLNKVTLEEKTLMGTLEDIQIRLEEMGKEVHHLEIELGSLATDLARFKIETEKLTRELSDLSEQIDKKKNHLESVVSGQKQKSSEIEIRQTEKNDLQKTIGEKEVAFKKFLEEKEDANQELTEIRLQAAAAKSNLRQSQIKVQNIEENIVGQKRQLQNRKEEKERLLIKMTEAEQKVAETQKELPEIQSKHTDLTNKLESLQTEKNRLQNDLEVSERRNKDVSEFEKEMRQKLSGQEVLQAKLQAELDAIRHLLDSEYDITLEDVLKAEKLNDNYEEVKENVELIRRKIKRLGAVNLLALDEFAAQKERLEFIEKQCLDLDNAKKDLEKLIKDLDVLAEKSFSDTFKKVKKNFESIFEKLFEGGTAELKLTDPAQPLESGVEIFAQPPGKKRQNLLLLSGGEKAMTAIALLFALMNVNPSPFIILDEIDAALDEVNNYRFAQMLREFTQNSHFMVITHKKQTMSVAELMYGVTMEGTGVSKLISMSLEKEKETVA